MTQSGDKILPENDEALEQLLGQATPRPLPPAAVTAEVRDAVRDEWQRVTRRHTRRRRLTLFAAAASVALAVAVSMNTWLASTPVPEQVATLEKAHGTIYLLGEQSQVRVADDLREVRSGQTIRTGRSEAAVGLRWHGGGSLRLDVDTEVAFVSSVRIELNSGRVYFDSQDVNVELTIVTPYGEVAHLGTRYMTSVDQELLVVSVRDGRVSVEGQFHDAEAKSGERISLAGSRPAERTPIEIYGPDWAWAETVAPAGTIDRQLLIKFLEWVSHETGLALKYENDDVENDVKDTKLTVRRVEGAPRDALKSLIRTTDFEYHESNGVLYISRAGN